MEEQKKRHSDVEKSEKDIVYSQAIKAGKRIYYLDVKMNRKEELFLAITESKKVIMGEGEEAQINFEKHKIFLYKEDLEKFQKAQNELSGALKSLLAVSEAYPNLKANENFRDLQVQLEGTENRIATARTRYTVAVQEYNTAIKKFPTVIYASWFGFSEKPQFKAEEGADKAPKIEF